MSVLRLFSRGVAKNFHGWPGARTYFLPKKHQKIYYFSQLTDPSFLIGSSFGFRICLDLRVIWEGELFKFVDFVGTALL